MSLRIKHHITMFLTNRCSMKPETKRIQTKSISSLKKVGSCSFGGFGGYVLNKANTYTIHTLSNGDPQVVFTYIALFQNTWTTWHLRLPSSICRPPNGGPASIGKCGQRPQAHVRRIRRRVRHMTHSLANLYANLYIRRSF